MSSEIIVLVPGLWMPSSALCLQSHWLQKYFPTFRFHYPSVRGNLTCNSRRLAAFCENFPADKIHFVSHSLGGLVTLATLRECTKIPVGRVVLLGVPVAGNQVARTLAEARILRGLLGKSMIEWLAQTPRDDRINCEIGVIAGSKSIGASRLFVPIPCPNDGVVTVSESALAGAKDSIVLNVSHSGMLLSRLVADQIGAFLMTGVFRH